MIIVFTGIIVVISIIISGLIIWRINSFINQITNIRIEKNSDLIQKYYDKLDRIETKTSDGIKISAWRFKVPEPKGIVIVLHGMHGMDASTLLDFGNFFKESNYEAFCLDMRAHGYSEGKRIGLGYTEVKDVSALLNWIKEKPEYKDKKIIIYGISMGGATAINTAVERKDIDMIISVSSFKSVESVFLYYMKKENTPELILKMFKPCIRLILSLKYKTNSIKNSPINKITKITKIPILLIHGDKDEQIPVQHADDLKKAAGDNVNLWIVKGAKHMVVTDILEPNKSWYRKKILNFINSNLN